MKEEKSPVQMVCAGDVIRTWCQPRNRMRGRFAPKARVLRTGGERQNMSGILFSSKPLTKRAFSGRVLVVSALVLLAAGCDDRRVLKGAAEGTEGARLVVPDTITPPILVQKVDGAPAAWKLRQKVAESLRQRDIPAGLTMRAKVVYQLKGKVVRIQSAGRGTQVTVLWRLYDTGGKKVGEVTQLAAIPSSLSGTKDAASAGSSDDVTQAMADAAAESLAPIVPSSRLRTTQQAMTGLPAPKTRRTIENRTKVTAIGKAEKKNSGNLSRNLLRTPPKGAGTARVDGGSAGAAGAAASGDTKSKTALGRRGGGGSLSRNLLRSGPGAGAAPEARPSRGTPPATGGTSPSTSDARPAGQGRQAAAGSGGSMENLMRRYPTRVEAEQRQNGARGAADTRTARPTAARPRSVARRTARRTEVRKAPRTGRLIASRKPVSARTVTRRVYWVQIGSYRSRGMAEQKWRVTRRAGGDPLRRAKRRIVRAEIERRGTYYRVQVGPYVARTKARSLCRDLKSRSIECFLYRDLAAVPATAATGRKARRVRTSTRTAVTTSRAAEVPSRNSARKRRVRKATEPRLGRDPRPDRAPVSTRPGLPGASE